MSNSSSVNGESGKLSGQKMTFTQTCNLLSQFVKEKRSFSLSPVDGSNGNNNRATMNLFPLNDPPVAEDSHSVVGPTIDLFAKSAFNSCEAQAGQMTIFYGGQVLVFNDLPNDKAKEIMDLASSIESTNKKRKLDQPTNLGPNQTLNVGSGFGLGVDLATLPGSAPGSVTNMTEMPIARKASLHRFLQKRKDRLVGSSVNVDVSHGAPVKGVDNNAWLGLGATMPVFQAQQQI